MANTKAQQWQKVKLGEIIQPLLTGKKDSNYSTIDGKYDFYTCSQEVFKCPTFSFENSGIILGGNNANAVYPLFFKEYGKFELYQRTYFIKSNSDNFYDKFLYYVLRIELENLKSVSVGSTTKYLTKPIIENILIPNFNISTQTKIATILSNYDDLIYNNTQRIKILEEMGKKLYDEWFVKFRFPVGQNSPSLEGVATQVDGVVSRPMVDSGTDFGIIPECWEVRKLGDLFKVKSGFPFKSILYSENGKYSVITIKNVKENDFDIDNVKYTNELPKNQEYILLNNCDILLSLTGNVGRVSAVFTGNKIPVLNQRVAKFIAKSDIVSNGLLYFYLSSGKIFNKLVSMSKGVAQQNLSPVEVENTCEILLPIRDILELSNIIFNDNLDKIINLNNQNQKLREMRDLLLPKLIRGDVDVSELEVV